jgi:hypothetical protein
MRPRQQGRIVRKSSEEQVPLKLPVSIDLGDDDNSRDRGESHS